MWLLLVACRQVPPEAEVQNLALLTIDTLRADHLAPWGGDPSVAPAIASFAGRATVFERAISAAPWTKASFGTMFTSQLPRDHGVTDWDLQLADEAETLPEVLQRAGFRTAAVVSHLAFEPTEGNNFDPGFDTFDTSVLDEGHPHTVSTAEPVADLALDQLDQLEPPWFLWVHFFDAHANYLAHPEHPTGDLPVERYDGEIAWIDDQLGRVLGALEPDPSVLIVLAGDHGEEFLDHGGTEHTRTVYDELVHVPLVLRWPGMPAGRVPETVGHIDLAPTLLAALDVAAPSAFTGQPVTRTADGWELDGDRMVFSETRRWGDVRGVTLGDYKLVHDLVAGTTTLYDHTVDPGETEDAGERLPEVRAQLLDALREAYPEVP